MEKKLIYEYTQYMQIMVSCVIPPLSPSLVHGSKELSGGGRECVGHAE